MNTLKKALLGPRTLRSAMGRITAPYDDTLFIALALSRQFHEAPGPFRLTVPGFSLRCQLGFVGGDERVQILKAVLGQLLQHPIPPRLTDPLQIEITTAARILTEAKVDQHEIRYSSWLTKPSRGGSLTWNPSLKAALELLRTHRML